MPVPRCNWVIPFPLDSKNRLQDGNNKAVNCSVSPAKPRNAWKNYHAIIIISNIKSSFYVQQWNESMRCSRSSWSNRQLGLCFLTTTNDVIFLVHGHQLTSLKYIHRRLRSGNQWSCLGYAGRDTWCLWRPGVWPPCLRQCVRGSSPTRPELWTPVCWSDVSAKTTAFASAAFLLELALSR